MADALTLDELLDLAKLDPRPVRFEVPALGGRAVYLRRPTSADADRWREGARKFMAGDSDIPATTLLVQLLICDESGKQLVPQTKAGADTLAALRPAAMDQIGSKALELISEPGMEEVEEEKKD